jgi:hypothetical protein
MPRIGKQREGRRLSLETSDAVRQRMEKLRDETDADSITEVIRRALAVYECLWDETKRGSQIIVRSGKKEREVLLIP